MSFSKKIKLGVVLSFLMSSVNAQAEATRISTIADWSLWESVNGQQTVCYIESSDIAYGEFGTTVNTYFRISKAKNSPTSPVEVMVQLLDNPRKSTGMLANISGASQISFSDMDGNRKSFWGIPKNLLNFTQQIHGGNGFKLKGVGGKRDAEVSITASGFRDIIREMENRCNGGAGIISSEFEQEFLAQVPNSVDPTRLDAAKTGELRGAYYAAYKTSGEITAAKAQLAQLLAKYQSLIDELNTNRASADQIQNSQLPQAQSDLDNAVGKQAEARAELARIESLIPGLNAKIKKSQKVLDDARSVIAPLQPEHDRIVQNLSSARNTLNESQSRLNYIESRLRDGAQQLNSIRTEADAIERWLPQKRSDLDRAGYNYRDAQNRRAQYNISWERDARLRNNFEYNRLHSDRNQMQSNLRQAEMDTQRARVERDRVARELQQCRTQPIIAELETEAAEPRPPGTPPGGGGGGGLVPGPRPPQPPPAPRPDCSYLESALNVANSQVAEREAAQRNYANRINEINSRISQIERQVDWDVRREYDLLISREDQARREYERLDREVRNDEGRLSQIRNSDIPRLENEQRSLSSEKPSVIARIDQAQSDVNRLSQELSNFESANDWGRKVAAVDSAERQLQSDQTQLDSVLSQKRLEQQKLDQNITLAQQAQERINSLNAQLAVLNRRATELNEGLKNLPTERAPIDNKIASLQTDLTNLKNKFVDLLK